MAAIHKGETLHALRRDLHFALQGAIRRSHLEQQTDQTLCLSLVTNAVVTWNTAYLQLALDAEEGGVDEALLAHLSPALLEHVNPYGIYRFDVDGEYARPGYRPLRDPRRSAPLGCTPT